MTSDWVAKANAGHDAYVAMSAVEHQQLVCRHVWEGQASPREDGGADDEWRTCVICNRHESRP